MENRELSSEDYVEIQKRLAQIDIHSMLAEKYESECRQRNFIPFHDLFARCTKSLRQTLIDPEKGFFPQKELVKINNGSNRCVVCSASFTGKYPNYIKTIIQGLTETGFNGYFLYYIGGWPNPTGREIRYVAVPYCFKIFAMVEAHQLGFNHVLWIDSACYPLKNIEPLFDIIEKDGALLNWYPPSSDKWRFLFPETRELLFNLTGVNVVRAKYINSIVMGIKMDSPEAKRFVQKYYELVELGTPFLSCFPEEFVFTAIINDGNYPNWTSHLHSKLVKTSPNSSDDSPKEFDLMRRKGAFFYQRKGR